jgi:D-cysteine desulfhydrase family pyridoxal phosphate-dependent enzyme
LKTDQAPLKKYKSIPRLSLANFMTPVERCDQIQKEFPGSPQIYIKRDDSTGFLIGGNKIRKLEYVMADVAKEKAATLLTIGSVQSNHARVTAMVARRLGLKCILILSGDIPDQPKGNLFLTNLLGVEIVAVGRRDERPAKMEEIARDLKARGEIVYQIPLGASDEIGSFGMTAAFEELLTQEARLDLEFDVIIIGSSSGGTQAGLEVGKRLFKRDRLRIAGISPDDSSASIKERVIAAANPMLSRLGLADSLTPDQLWVDDSHIGQGYGMTSPEAEAASSLFAQSEGIFLDPVYTSKTAAALLDFCRKGMFSRRDNVLFWHTGGLIALFN